MSGVLVVVVVCFVSGVFAIACFVSGVLVVVVVCCVSGVLVAAVLCSVSGVLVVAVVCSVHCLVCWRLQLAVAVDTGGTLVYYNILCFIQVRII